jgi:PAS domain S-box-containing protein/putative nucleotidyltransferase with HDIG domain
VDDNQNNLFTLSALLETAGDINSIEVLSAKEGLDILLKESVDLILLDVQMPEMNGFEFAKLVKSNKKTREIPIIFVTAVFKSEEFIKEGFDLGAVDYLTKPIDDNQLLNKISLYLKLFEKNSKLKQSEKKFIDIAQSIGDGIYTLDLEDKVTFINKVALRMLGFKEKELMGQRIHEYIHYKSIENEMVSSTECEIHKVTTQEKNFANVDTHFVKKDGTFLAVSLLATPIYDDNSVIGTVIVFRDKSQENKIHELEDEKLKNQEQIIHSMVNMIESRDSYTAGHTKRVAQYCELIAKEMSYSKEEIEILRKAAWLHDIGKISTPDSVLLKPGKLSDIEYELIQDHLTSGYNLLNEIDQYRDIAEIMREHHEKFDGSGYPRGIKKDEIHPLSRIMIVADAFDAMTTNRVYKPRKSIDVALRELETLSAKHFHPEVVSAALKALKNIEIDGDISQLPQSKIEQQRFSYFYKDRLTELFIIEYLPLLIRYRIESDSAYFYSVDLHNFSQYNKQYSWKEGDKFLISFSKYMDNLYEKTILFRVEGDDFLILSEKKLENVESDIQKFPLLEKSVVNCSVHERFISDFESLDDLQEVLKK